MTLQCNGLVRVLLSRFFGKDPAELLGAEGLSRVLAFPWAGNVRELRNFAERVLAFGPERAFRLQRGSEDGDTDGEPSHPDLPEGELEVDPNTETLHAFREKWASRAEATYLRALLQAYGKNLTQAARVAGIARGHIYRLIDRYKA